MSGKNTEKNIETEGLSKLGGVTSYRYRNPGPDILEAFANLYPQRDYLITLTHPEFTSLCPLTGQPDFATVTVRYVPDKLCVESKSFKLYMAAYRDHGAFMESLTNKIADDLIAVLSPRRLSVSGVFNVRGGTAISVQVDHIDPSLPGTRRDSLASLWRIYSDSR
ncbi:MAG: preQ(1) synthase [Desulfarculales bacterium]|nr:preQ(1) synthase [Desulfarculales bacterium]